MNNFLVYISIWIYGLLILLFGWFALEQLPWYSWMSVILLVLMILVLKWISRLSMVSADYWSHIISPVLFFITGIFSQLFLEGVLLHRIFIIIFALVLILYLHNFWLFYRRPEKYHAFMLENFTWYLTSFSAFMLFVTLFGLEVFVNFSVIWSVIILMIFTGLSTYKLWWIEKLKWKNIWLPAIIMQIIAVEIFFILMTLPLSYLLLAFWGAGIWLISQRMVIDIGKSTFYYRQVIKLSSLFILIAIVLTATARWF